MNTYRPELDGLRGLAVLIIILSHFNNTFLQSGGVNIFFVLSGFFMAQITAKNNFSFQLSDFYGSRIRSLFPQLILITAISYTLILFFGDLQHAAILHNSFIYSITGLFNIMLIKIGDVYTLQNWINPFLPLWAFSVIIQFYFLFPIVVKIIVFLITKLRLDFKYLFPIFVFITIFSFIFYFINIGNNIGNFYSTLARLWQFFIGCSLFYFIHFYNSSSLAKISGHFGFLLLIIWQVLPMIINTFFIKTVIITFAAVFIIYSTQGNNKKNMLLSNNLSVFLGKISYPLYLFHMPIIYFLSLYFDGMIIIIITLLSSLVLSIISNKFDKSFIMNGISVFVYKANKKIKLLFWLILIIIFTFSFNHLKNNHEIDPYTSYLSKISPFNYINNLREQFNKTYSDYGYVALDVKGKDGLHCHNHPNFAEQCFFEPSLTNKKESSIFIIGGSQISSVGASLKDEVLNMGYGYRHITLSACPYIEDFERINFVENKISNTCSSERHAKVKDLLIKNINNIAVLAGRFPIYLSLELFDNGEGGIEGGANNKWDTKFYHKYREINLVEGYKNSVLNLLKSGINVILVYPLPAVGWHVPNRLLMRYHKLNNYITTSYDRYLERTEESFKMLDDIGQHPNLYRVYPHKLYCNTVIPGRCITHDKNTIFYADDDHPTIAGANKIKNLIIDKIYKIENK